MTRLLPACLLVALSLFGLSAAPSQAATTSFTVTIYSSAAPAFGWRVWGPTKTGTIEQDPNPGTSWLTLVHPRGFPTGYYTIRSSGGYCLGEYKSRNIVEEADGCYSHPPLSQLFVVVGGPGRYGFYASRFRGEFAGFWGPPADGNKLRIRSPQHNFYDGFTLFGNNHQKVTGLPTARGWFDGHFYAGNS